MGGCCCGSEVEEYDSEYEDSEFYGAYPEHENLPRRGLDHSWDNSHPDIDYDGSRRPHTGENVDMHGYGPAAEGMSPYGYGRAGAYAPVGMEKIPVSAKAIKLHGSEANAHKVVGGTDRFGEGPGEYRPAGAMTGPGKVAKLDDPDRYNFKVFLENDTGQGTRRDKEKFNAGHFDSPAFYSGY
eukprot:CAMPEP_0179009866 /NCGR_PEP_ID=MMETSP0795-20121207/16500_1 /TAXON_ID=88552 /ORGANISM="Amoebophrya sp., Strain Ameob2" /LENGTH=182 /DNA_ID=CAMNT_0020705091 /DNA_START=73 /DNA_END=621 /DNA_ORIENTATION=+